MGVIVNKTGNETAYNYLSKIAVANPATLRELKWMPATEAPGGGSVGAELAVAATWGLAVSGKPEAAKTLEKINQQEAVGRPKVQRAANEALKTMPTIRKSGLKKYFTEHHGH